MPLLDDQAVEQLLDAPPEPNKPAKLRGMTGPRPVVSTAEQRARREAVASMLSQGVSRDQIFEVMGAKKRPDGSPGFAMTETGVRNLIQEVYETWSAEDAEDRPHLKAHAIRRIKKNIQLARKKGAFTAIAQMERTLMLIEGTSEPIEVRHTGLERLSGAVVQVLNLQSPEQLEELLMEETRSLREHVTAPELPAFIEVPVEQPNTETIDDDDE